VTIDDGEREGSGWGVQWIMYLTVIMGEWDGIGACGGGAWSLELGAWIGDGGWGIGDWGLGTGNCEMGCQVNKGWWSMVEYFVCWSRLEYAEVDWSMLKWTGVC